MSPVELPDPSESANLPAHVAIIMDGNNRYARKYGLPAGDGHRVGKDQLDPITEHCLNRGVRALTVFAFSSENWHRPPLEVELLMHLFTEVIAQQLPKMHANQVSMRFIGDRSRLSLPLQQQMLDAEQRTAAYTRMVLSIAVSYGGMWDMAHAARRLAEQVQAGTLRLDEIDVQHMQAEVSLGDLPPVDLLIRTGGDYRLSNFLLWQAAYAELYFTDTLWPEFAVEELEQAFALFGQRERRFGRTSEQVRESLSCQAESGAGAQHV